MKRHTLEDFNFEKRIVVDENGCWNWTKGLTQRGYGKLSFAGKDVTAHRISWLKYKGPIPDGMLVCHHCDNCKCVNPDHLFIGNSMENNHDMMRKGRHTHGDAHWTRLYPERLPKGDEHPLRKNPSLAARGERHGRYGNPHGTVRGEAQGSSKLTDVAVMEIRTKFINGKLQYQLAEEYGVYKASISKVITGASWQHVPMPYFMALKYELNQVPYVEVLD